MIQASRKPVNLWRIGAAFLFVLLAVLAGERAWHGLKTQLKLSSAVHHSSDVAARLSAHWEANGTWPPPGEMINRGLSFSDSTIEDNGDRVDEYQGIPGPVVFILKPDGTMLVFLRD